MVPEPDPKVLQNGLYDINFLWKTMGIAVQMRLMTPCCCRMHSSPSSEKGLAFLGSIYTDESSWKLCAGAPPRSGRSECRGDADDH